MRYDVSHLINKNNASQLAYRVNTLWGKKAPLLSLSSSDKEWGDIQLAELGIPKEAWFVCVHVREGGFSSVDEVLHSHRNGDIANVISSIEEVTRRGGWVVRLGDPTMKLLKKMPKVIDYAHHSLRSPRLDIILCARARFILGNTSGLFLVGTAFGVPSALANMVPMPTLGLNSDDLSIPKLYWLEKEGRYLTFPEVMNSPISQYRYAALYKENNITVLENTAEDILSLTIEMLDRLEGKFEENDEDMERHVKFMSLLHAKHYAYGAASKLQYMFLRKYDNLL
jgi:putative glycosyltransferase (TIGR04372 family)